jgi:hypothetical protein
MRSGVGKIRALLETHPDDPLIILQCGTLIVELAQALPEAIGAIRSALDLSTMKHCSVDAN